MRKIIPLSNSIVMEKVKVKETSILLLCEEMNINKKINKLLTFWKRTLCPRICL